MIQFLKDNVLSNADIKFQSNIFGCSTISTSDTKKNYLAEILTGITVMLLLYNQNYQFRQLSDNSFEMLAQT